VRQIDRHYTATSCARSCIALLVSALFAASLVAACGGGSHQHNAVEPAPGDDVAALGIVAPSLPANPAVDTTCPATPEGTVNAAYRAAGSGPVYVVAARDANGTVAFNRDTPGGRGSGFAATKMMWLIAPAYTGELTVRGKRIDKAGVLSFSNASDGSSLTIAPATGPGWRQLPSTEWVTEAGCYELDVQGVGVSQSIYFSASVS
jgi:hypothetical protein